MVYEDPWRAGGHNGLSNSEDPEIPEAPKSRVAEVRKVMNDLGLGQVPIVMAGGVWYMRDWVDWIDDPDIAPVAFQFGTRPLLTRESPISDQWKQRLLGLKEDVSLNKYSPTGFYSSAVRNSFLQELRERADRQIAFPRSPLEGESGIPDRSARPHDFRRGRGQKRAEVWMKEDFNEGMRTPDSTVIFVSGSMAKQIRSDQSDCMGCLSQCQFSNWAQNETGTTGREPDPRSYCIQKTLQDIVHSENVDEQLMFAGHNAYKFRDDPFYANGYIPTVKELMERLHTGD